MFVVVFLASDIDRGTAVVFDDVHSVVVVVEKEVPAREIAAEKDVSPFLALYNSRNLEVAEGILFTYSHFS